MPKITEVEYRCLKSHGNYENTSFGARALVEQGETPEEAMDKLRTWTEDRAAVYIASHDELYDLRNKKYEAQAELSEITRKTIAATQRFNEMKAVLAAHGVALAEEEQVSFTDPFANQ